MESSRKFEKISQKEYQKYSNLFAYSDIELPERQTNYSCGYDFVTPHDIIIKPNEIKIVYSGIKVHLNEDEFLMLAIRSSKAIKQGIVLANQVGIIDCDYYNNCDNEGHIMIALRNISDKEVKLEKKERVAQGIIMKYLLCDDDSFNKKDKERLGGIGSTKNK